MEDEEDARPGLPPVHRCEGGDEELARELVITWSLYGARNSDERVKVCEQFFTGRVKVDSVTYLLAKRMYMRANKWVRQ